MRREVKCHVCRREFPTQLVFADHHCGSLSCPDCGQRVVAEIRLTGAGCVICGGGLEPSSKVRGQTRRSAWGPTQQEALSRFFRVGLGQLGPEASEPILRAVS